MRRRTLAALLAAVCLLPPVAHAADVFDRVRHRYVQNGDVRIHYATLGRGPLVVMIHGFPDFWYGWRDQMAGLARHYQVAALDLRGYNLSDQPRGVEQYDLSLLAGDVAAVVRDLGRERATIVGHDWGGGVAWVFAILHPAMTERLIVLQTPHPRGLWRELRTNPAQQANSQYARVFQMEGAHLGLTAEGLAGWVRDPAARRRYVEAFARSDFEAMLHYYKRNYPREPYPDLALRNVQAPVLVIHGLADPFLLAAGHNSTWDWVDAPVTIATVPGVGHFVQQDASVLVTRTMKRWLRAPVEPAVPGGGARAAAGR
jgi:pimeloyl-ACP methyl ester carboxylesterase